MKSRLTITTLCALFLCAQAIAQPVVNTVKKLVPKVTVGVKAGANFQTLAGKTWASTYKPGILGGAFVGVYKGKWGVQVEGLVKSARFDIKAPSNAYITSLSLDIPVLAEYKIFKRLWVQAGPQFTSLISETDHNTGSVKNLLKSSDISGVAGLEVKLPFHLTAGARYIIGLTDINNNKNAAQAGTDAWKTSYAQIYVGFRFL